MRSLIFYGLLSLCGLVLSKNPNIKTLTDPMGREIIEITGPKELPPSIDEEPSAENEDYDVNSTTTAPPKKDMKKVTALTGNRKMMKDIEKIDKVTTEDEESRLEKELSEIYKDPEYKDSSEVTNEPTESTVTVVSEVTEKLIARARAGFKFAPDSTNKKDIERFRTSTDDIDCNNRQKLKMMPLGLTTKTYEENNKSDTNNSATKLRYTINCLINLFFVKILYP